MNRLERRLLKIGDATLEVFVGGDAAAPLVCETHSHDAVVPEAGPLAVAALTTPEAYAARFARQRERAEAERTGMRQEIAAGAAGTSGDGALTVLRGRLAVQEAAGVLLDLNDDRMSVTHFVDSVERALAAFGRRDLFAPFLAALDLEAGAAGIRRSLATLESSTGRLREWLREPAFRAAFSEEDLAWSEFTCGEETREEIAHKVEVLGAQPGRLPALQFYLDGCIHVHVGIQFGRTLRQRLRGDATRVLLPEVHALLREYAAAEPSEGAPLLAQWIGGLRLAAPSLPIEEIDALADALVATGAVFQIAGARINSQTAERRPIARAACCS